MPKISSITFAAAGMLAAAIPVAKADSQADRDLLCQTIAVLAEGIMTNRQNGVPMGSILKAWESTDVGKTQPAALTAARAMVIAAYDQPHYSTPEIQQRTIGDFRDQMHVLCLQRAPQ